MTLSKNNAAESVTSINITRGMGVTQPASWRTCSSHWRSDRAVFVGTSVSTSSPSCHSRSTRSPLLSAWSKRNPAPPVRNPSRLCNRSWCRERRRYQVVNAAYQTARTSPNTDRYTSACHNCSLSASNSLITWLLLCSDARTGRRGREHALAEHLQRQVHPFGMDPLEQLRPYAARFKLPDGMPVGVHGGLAESEQVLKAEGFALHPRHFRDVRHLALAARQPGDVDHQVDGRRHLLADGDDGEIQPRHRHHVFDAADGVARVVRVDRRHRAVVARVHRLQDVQRFGPAHLAEDDAVG